MGREGNSDVLVELLMSIYNKYIMTIITSKFRSKLGNLAENPAQYQKLLEGLIAQAIFQVCEKECVVKCREEDIDLVKKAIPVAQVLYQLAGGTIPTSG